MDTGSVTADFRALNDARVRYVVVGGLAVLAHGVLRATNDIDIVLDLEEDNLLAGAYHLLSRRIEE